MGDAPGSRLLGSALIRSIRLGPYAIQPDGGQDDDADTRDRLHQG